MNNSAITAFRPFAGRSAILALALLWNPGAASAGSTTVTAVKDGVGPGIPASFHLEADQWVRFQAAFAGEPKALWIHGPVSNYQVTTGTPVGCLQLGGPATYHIMIEDPKMGPGTYTIRYAPTGNGNSSADNGCQEGHLTGEPHVTTVNGVRYDFQSAGEFVALRGESGMEIQTRQTPLPALPPVADGHSGLTAGVALNSAVAARVNDHRVTYQMGPQTTAGAAPALELRVDGAPTVLRSDGLALGTGGRLSPLPDNGIRIDFPDGTTLAVTANLWPAASLWYLNLDVSHTPAHQGIMGTIARRNWLPALPDGSELGRRPRSAHQRYVDLYQRFADAWRVTDRTSLFDYERGTSTATFALAGWPGEAGAVAVAGRAAVRPLGGAAARRACRGIAGRNLRRDCVFDVRATGDRGFAASYARVERVRGGMTATRLESLPDRGNDAGRAAFAATVDRPARSGRAALAGGVQFTVDGVDSGAPVSLGAGGRASWQAPRLDAGEHRIGARYIPAAGSAFLPSEGFAIPHVVRPGY